MRRKLVIGALCATAGCVSLGSAPATASADAKTCTSYGKAIGFGIYAPAACDITITCTTTQATCLTRMSMFVSAYWDAGHVGTIKGAGQSRRIPKDGSTPNPSTVSASCFTAYPSGRYGYCIARWTHVVYDGDQLVVACRAPAGLLPVVRFAAPYVLCNATDQ